VRSYRFSALAAIVAGVVRLPLWMFGKRQVDFCREDRGRWVGHGTLKLPWSVALGNGDPG